MQLTKRAAMTVGSACVLNLLLSGCYMSDPEPPVFGVRVHEGSITVKIPMCLPGQIASVRISRADNQEIDLFRASGRRSDSPSNGQIVIWAAGSWGLSDFTDRKVFDGATAIPEKISVGYRGPGGDGSGDVLDLAKAAASDLPEGSFWTRRGVLSERDVENQSACNAGK